MVDILLVGLITLNVVAVIFESVESYGVQYRDAFRMFELVSVLIFSVEYLARVWSAVEHPEVPPGARPAWVRLRFMLTPMALIDLIVILPFYLSFFFAMDLRFLRVMRVLRVFKLTRYSASLALLGSALRRESQAIAAALFVMVLLVVMAASLTYIVEHEAQPEAFGSIPAAMWWAVVTMTTVGYGDVVPVTTAGRILAASISILSMGMVAMPAGLLASGFIEALRERREQFTEMVEDALEDGIIDGSEEELLQHLRERLGMGEEEAESILRRSRRDSARRQTDLEFVASVETAVTSGELTEAEAHAIEEAGLALGISREEAHRLMKIFGKHLRGLECPHCGKPARPGGAGD